MGLLIMTHGLEDVHGLQVVGNSSVETKCSKYLVVTHDDIGVDSTKRVRESRREAETDRDRFAVTQFVDVVPQRQDLDRVRERVSVVQQRSSTTLEFVVGHDIGLQPYAHLDQF